MASSTATGPVVAPNQQPAEDKRIYVKMSSNASKYLDSPSGNDANTLTLARLEVTSPMAKYATPQKTRAEIAGLKDEVDDLRHQLREESARKKAVLKDIELQTRQLQAAEARLKVMAIKMNELAQSKHELASKKAASDKELLQLKAKWDSAARKLDKIHEAVARSSNQIAVANKEKGAAESRVAELTAELAKKKDLETQCIELSDKLALAGRQVEQLQLELSTTKEAYSATERTSEETQNQLYALATTVSQLRNDLDAEMNYSTQRKTELAVLRVEKKNLEQLLASTQSGCDSSMESIKAERDQCARAASDLKTQLDTLLQEFETHRHQNAASVVQMESELQSLQEKLTQQETGDEERAQRVQELEQQLQGYENEREALKTEVVALQDDLKARQEENRRMDERVNFLESAMDFVRGELKEKTDELDELKQVNATLHHSLSEHSSDLASAHAAQQQLAHSLLIANERIKELETSLAEAEKTTQSSAMEVSALREELDQAKRNAEEAQQNAKEDLETIRVELEAESVKLAISEAQLAERTKAHDALQSAHEALQLAHANMKRELEERFEQLAQSRSEQHELVEHNQNLAVQRDSLEEKLTGLVRELQSSQEVVSEQASVVAKLKAEVAALTTAAEDGAAKLERLEQQLQASADSLSSLSLERDTLTSEVGTLTTEVNTLQGSVSSLNSEVDALRSSRSQLEASLKFAQDEKAALIEKNDSDIKVIQDSANTTIATLKSELSAALESALDLVSANTDLAAENSAVKTQVEALQHQAIEHAQVEARHMESQRASVNQITELRAELKSRSDTVEAAQHDLEKQLRIMEECHQGRLAAQAVQFERQIKEVEEQRDSEISRISASARSQVDAAQATHYKQMESLHISLNELKQALADSQSDLQQKTLDFASLQRSSQDLTEQLSVKNSEAVDLKSAIAKSESTISSMNAEIDQFKSQIATLQASSQDLSSQVASSQSHISELQGEKTQLESYISSTKAELSDAQKSLEALLQTSATLSAQVTSSYELIKVLQAEKVERETAFATLQHELSEVKASKSELEQVSVSVSSQLANANELVSDLQMEKKHAESGMAALKQELARYQEQLSETDAVLATLQTENDTLKEEITRTKKTSDDQVAIIQAEKKQWMGLAESQTKELEQLSKEITTAHDEVATWKAHCEALRVKRDQEERDANDMRVKRLNHELNMANAEVTRQKNRVQTREAAIAAGKAREEKLQTNLDSQIEKCRDLQRQLADRDREAIIAAGRARATSKPERPAPSAPPAAPSEALPSLDEIHDMSVQLSDAKAEIARLEKQLEVEKEHTEHLIAEQTKLTGHNNPKQKIQFTHKLMKENHELKLERANLLAQLEKKGVDSPHRKSLTRAARPRQTALAIVAAGKTVAAFEGSLADTFKAHASAQSSSENAQNVQQQ